MDLLNTDAAETLQTGLIVDRRLAGRRQIGCVDGTHTYRYNM
jgi:hypothetical protein